MESRSWKRRSLLPGAVVALLALTGCPGPQKKECGGTEYEAAVADATEAKQEEIYSGLWAITPSNTKLTWSQDQAMVKMVAWTTYTGYQQGDNTLSREVWVTAVPQLKELCAAVVDAERVERINQYLGLPPATERDQSRQFVEMWVKPEDMFRPCADPEITDTVCGTQFPEGVSQDHKDWFTRNYSSSFGFWQTTRYPWTGLGYTYDWCTTGTEVGASEFVIRSGSTVNVIGYIDRQTYCGM